MKYSLPLGRLAGIQVFVHWTFALLLIWIVFINVRAGHGASDTLWSILFIFAIFGCVVLHELGHALAARRYGIDTRDITLLPIGGVARLEKMPEKPKQELVVALAGPLVNVVIVLVLFPIVYYTAPRDIEVESFARVGSANFLPLLMTVNIILAVFNMIPAFPMDGGRVLRAIVSFYQPRHVATRIAATIGQVLAIGFVILGFFSNPFLIFIGLFIFLGAQAEAEHTKAQSLLAGYLVKDALMRNAETLSPHEPLARAVQMLLNGQSRNFLVLENEAPIGTLSREELIKALSEKGDQVRIGEVMNTQLLQLDADAPLEEAWTAMQEKKTEMATVMERQAMIGILDTENIAEFIMVQNARGAAGKR